MKRRIKRMSRVIRAKNKMKPRKDKGRMRVDLAAEERRMSR